MRAARSCVGLGVVALLGCGGTSGTASSVDGSAESGPADAAGEAPVDASRPPADGSLPPIDGGAFSDAPGSDSALTDAPPPDTGVVDAGDLASTLEGIWVLGWAGGLNHFSWVRFDPLAAGGQADYLPGTEIPANAPYWNCSGTGSWLLTQAPNTVMLTFPASCNLMPLVLTFDSIGPHMGYPPAAILDATLSTNPAGQALTGWKFSPTQCNATMTMCTNPF